MKVNKKAESLIWIIIWVFILSFVIIWIWTLIWNSKDLIRNFDMKMDLELLTTSSYSIINNMDTSSLLDWDVFYLYKDDTNKVYDLKKWVSNSKYKNIDKYWNYLNDPDNFWWTIYLREFKATKITYIWKDKILIDTKISRLIK